MSTKTIIKKIV